MRRKLKILGAAFLFLGLLGIAAYFIFQILRPRKAAISVSSTPISVVFINEEQVGRTPYEGRQNPGEVTIKLVPESFDKPLAPYETKITLTASIRTVVRRTFGDSDETSSGEVISFEKTGVDIASLAVISIPDQVEVLLDGQLKGFTPLKISLISPGKHQLKFVIPGYKESEFTIDAAKGYRLTSVVYLAKDLEARIVEKSEEKTEEKILDEEEKQVKVEILSTPVGFLRVRREPSTLAEEIGQVKPGQKYKLLDTDKKTGWFKIEYLPGQAGEEGKIGWISNQYAKKTESP